MCGIAGIIHFDGKPVEQSDLKKMTDAIAHRGPDGEGFFIDGAVGFGHRRLAVIDLSPAGMQPMTRFGCTITYNGEIYNYVELRKQLLESGWHFSTQTDTEVILAAYQKWGPSCVNYLNGMWAFALYDPANQIVFCSRDRFGEKPFYYVSADKKFLFASEIRGIREAMPAEPLPNKIMMARFLAFEQAEHFRETFFCGVLKLEAAHQLLIDLRTGSIKSNPYYSLLRTDEWRSISIREATALLREKLQHAVSIRIRSDVKVGTCLSGGLDSSAIAWFASKLYKPQIFGEFTGITAGSADVRKDETSYAREVASALSMDWQPTTPKAKDFETVFETVLKAQEEPFDSSSVLMQYMLMQHAHRQGLRVLLDGQGADEVLLGYKQHLAWALNELPIFQAGKLAIQSLKKYQISPKELLLLLTYHSVAKRKRARQLFKWKALRKDLYQQLIYEADVEAGRMNDLFSKQRNELEHRSLPMLLRYEDKNAMAFSIETRLPFLDKEVVEFLMNIPTPLKVRNGWSKYLLRMAISGDLPDIVVWRRGKIGFEVGDVGWSVCNFAPKNAKDMMGILMEGNSCSLSGNEKMHMAILDSWMSTVWLP